MRILRSAFVGAQATQGLALSIDTVIDGTSPGVLSSADEVWTHTTYTRYTSQGWASNIFDNMVLGIW
jgi:hypothetical protein